MNLHERISLVLATEKTKKVWRNKFESTEYKQASSLNYELFGMRLNKRIGCQCVDDLFFMLRSYTSEKITLKQKQIMSQFELKKNKMIVVHGHEPLTNANMTDEKALILLKKYPAHVSSFEKLPNNIDELLGKPQLKAKKTDDNVDEQSMIDSKVMETLKSKTVGELREIAKEYPANEWESMKKNELVQYLFDKSK
jgi:hypothetical protein